jgi:tripartite ATP-independent transporter DctM subunit
MVVYKEIRIADLPGIFLKSAKTTSVVMLLVGASQAMSWVLALEQVPQSTSAALLSISQNPIVTLLLINVLLLMVGTFMDMTPAVLIFTPIFLPVVTGLGMDPVHFGVLMIANLCIGLYTPPVGTCLLVGCGVGGTTIAKLMRPLLPMVLAALVALMIISYVPALSLWLPGLLGL